MNKTHWAVFISPVHFSLQSLTHCCVFFTLLHSAHFVTNISYCIIKWDCWLWFCFEKDFTPTFFFFSHFCYNKAVKCKCSLLCVIVCLNVLMCEWVGVDFLTHGTKIQGRQDEGKGHQDSTAHWPLRAMSTTRSQGHILKQTVASTLGCFQGTLLSI